MAMAIRSIVGLLLVISGCVAHESVGRPPAPADIERINAYAQAHGDLRIEYVNTPLICASASCLHSGQLEEIAAIVSSNTRDTVVQAEDGKSWTLRTETIASAHARNRLRGAAVGALIGAAVGIALTVAYDSVIESGGFRDSDPSAPPPSTADSEIVKVGFLLTVTQTMGWAALGYLVGGRQSFDFDSVPSAPHRNTAHTDAPDRP
jgi:hypothetical protein